MVVFEVLQQVYQILGAIAPVGVEPALFFGTLLLIYGVIFVALGKVHFFQDDQYRAIRFVIAGVLAYFASSSIFVTTVFSQLFPNFAIAAVGIVIFMVILGMLGIEKMGNITWLIVIIVIWFVASTTMAQLTPFVPGLSGINVAWAGITTTDLIIIGGIILVLFIVAGGKDRFEGLLKG
jgi:hypothetical protein